MLWGWRFPNMILSMTRILAKHPVLNTRMQQVRVLDIAVRWLSGKAALFKGSIFV